MKAQNARPSCCCCFWRRWCPDASPLIPWPVAVAAIFEAASDAEWKVCALRGNKAASRRSAVSGRRHLPQQMQQMWQLCNGLWQLRSLPRTVQIDLPESIIRTSSTMENLSAIFLAIAVRTDRVSSASSASSLLISCPPFPVRTLTNVWQFVVAWHHFVTKAKQIAQSPVLTATATGETHLSSSS